MKPRLLQGSFYVQSFSAILLAALAALSQGPASASAEVVYFGQTFEIFGPSDPNLDLTGNIVGVNAASATNRPVGTMTFLSEANAQARYGITISGSTAGQGIPEFGSTTDDNNFELVFDNGRHAQPSISIPVIPGSRYKIQLLASEQTHAATPPGRGMDIFIEGQQAVDEMPVYKADGKHQSAFRANSATLYTYTLTATDNVLNIDLRNSSTFPDNNPYFQALTIENLTTTVGVFTGGDPGEGLRLQGPAIYAVSTGGPGGMKIQDTTFTADSSTPGVTVVAENVATNWNTGLNYGATANDDGLELLMRDIRWTDTFNGVGPANISADLANLVPGRKYLLQMLLDEGCCNRRFDISIEGDRVVTDLTLFTLEGGGMDKTKGVVVAHEFFARDSVLNIVLDGSLVAAGFDRNPILQALVLQEIPEPSTFALLGLGMAGLGLYNGRRRGIKGSR